MKLKRVLLGLALTLSCTGLVGCRDSLKSEMTSAINAEKEIKMSVPGADTFVEREDVEWTELDQLKSYKDIRKTWDDQFQVVIFDVGSKNGPLFVDTEGNWAGNNVLYNVFQNKAFIKDFWDNYSLKSAISQKAIEEFSDITNESTGLIASINAYFNLIPANADGTSGLMQKLSRAEAMSIIYRGDTPVIFTELDKSFEAVVGTNEYNNYAIGVNNDSYLKYQNNSLNWETYNTPMTRAEAIYILMNRYFEDELATAPTKWNLADCKNAGNVMEELGFTGKFAAESYELEYCLQNPDNGAPETLFKALALANQLGILSSDTRWNEGINAGELITLMTSTYTAKREQTDFLVNAKTGANAGESLLIMEAPPELEPVITSETLVGTSISQVLDVTDLDDLFEIYGDEITMTEAEIKEAYEIADMFTFEPCDKWMQVDHCGYLNVRTGPSTDFRILKSVPKETKVHIVARCNENGWYRVIADGKIIYQCGVYFSDFEGSDEYLIRSGAYRNVPLESRSDTFKIEDEATEADKESLDNVEDKESLYETTEDNKENLDSVEDKENLDEASTSADDSEGSDN